MRLPQVQNRPEKRTQAPLPALSQGSCAVGRAPDELPHDRRPGRSAHVTGIPGGQGCLVLDPHDHAARPYHQGSSGTGDRPPKNFQFSIVNCQYFHTPSERQPLSIALYSRRTKPERLKTVLRQPVK